MTVSINEIAEELRAESEANEELIRAMSWLQHPAYALEHHGEVAEETDIPKIDKLAADGKLSAKGAAYWQEIRPRAVEAAKRHREMAKAWNDEFPEIPGNPPKKDK